MTHKLMNLRNKTVLVLGMGETGLSMAKWLSRMGANVRVADSRTVPPGMEELKQALPHALMFTGAFTAEAFAGIDLIAISPGVCSGREACAAGNEGRRAGDGGHGTFCLGNQVAKCFKTNNSGHYRLQRQDNGNGHGRGNGEKSRVGCRGGGKHRPAVLDALMRRVDSGRLPQAWVLEVSSFQLETMQNLGPDAATVLNLSEDHLDRYDGMREYAAAKARIFLDAAIRQGGDAGMQILNRDDSMVREMALSGRKQITFGLDLPIGHSDFGLLREDGNSWLVQGSHALDENQ